MRIGRTIAIAITATALGVPAYAAPTAPTAPVKVIDTTQVMTMPGGSMPAMMLMHGMGSIRVDGTGEVQYTPDIARVTLGVNGEAPSADAAANDIASRANAVIAALKGLGISAGDIQTSGYSLYYRQPTETVKAAFVASEDVTVKTSVDKAGQAIDAGLRAGANQTYGLMFDTSKRDALYRQAVDSAVKAARDIAQTAATAAGVKLGPVMSIEVSGGGSTSIVPLPMMRPAGVAMPPPVAPGTGTMSTTVTVTYRIAGTPGMMAPAHP